MFKKINISKIREKLAKVDLKSYLYVLGIIAVIVVVVSMTNNEPKYGKKDKDGVYQLDLKKIAEMYNLDIDDYDVAKIEEPYTNDYVYDYDKNTTKDLTTSLYATTLFMDQNGLTDATLRGKILADIILEYKRKIDGKIYEERDLSVIRNDDKNSISEYQNEIGEAIDEYYKTFKDIAFKDVNSYKEMTDSNVASIKGDIVSNTMSIIDANDFLINKLLSIVATKDGAYYQIALINSLSKLNSFLITTVYLESDPMKFLLLDSNVDTSQLKENEDESKKYFDSIEENTNNLINYFNRNI